MTSNSQEFPTSQPRGPGLRPCICGHDDDPTRPVRSVHSAADHPAVLSWLERTHGSDVPGILSEQHDLPSGPTCIVQRSYLTALEEDSRQLTHAIAQIVRLEETVSRLQEMLVPSTETLAGEGSAAAERHQRRPSSWWDLAGKDVAEENKSLRDRIQSLEKTVAELATGYLRAAATEAGATPYV